MAFLEIASGLIEAAGINDTVSPILYVHACVATNYQHNDAVLSSCNTSSATVNRLEYALLL